MSRIVKSWYATYDQNTIVIEHELPQEQVYEPPPVPSLEEEAPPEPKIDLAQVKQQAEAIKKQITDEANAFADDIIEKAKADAEEIKKEALEHANTQAIGIREQAEQHGYDAGITKAQTKADEIIAQAEDVKAEAHIYKEELIKNIEPEMIDLVVSVLDNLIEVEKEINPQAISVIIKNGLSNTSTVENVVVHVSPDNYEQIDKTMILSSMDAMANVSFIEDPTIQSLDCIIETPLGNIDCGLDTQYESLRRHLLYVLKNR